jgi:hypothetical protein
MEADDVIVGPARLLCEQQCEVPPGVRLAPVPTPRHNWGDVLVCPNEGCGRAWLKLEVDRAGDA